MKTNFQGRAIHNPILKVAIWVFVLIIVLISLPIHLLLKVTGRKGFLEWDGLNANYDAWAMI